MRGSAWRGPLSVGGGGLAISAGVAALGGITVDAGLKILLYSAASALIGALVALAVRRLAPHRSLAVLTGAAALAPLLAVGIAVGWAAREMFLAPHDVVIVCVSLVTAATLGLMIAMLLGRQVGQASRTVTIMARRLADADPELGAGPGHGAPGELVALARELEEASSRLREARQRASDAEGSRRNLVAGVSHDLRTPLAGIRAMVESIEDGVVRDDETISRYHATIRVEVERLAGLVDDLFELSRIEAGAVRLEREWVPLDELVGAAVKASRATAGSVELVTAVSPGPIVLMSATEIVRVVRNLVDNAVRHTPIGGRVVVEAGGGYGHGWISVSDGCGGIPAEEIGQVFEAGFRGNTARTPGDGRGGLGLAVARGLVDAHGGSIDVCNVGPGCRFRVHFPRTAMTPGGPGFHPPGSERAGPAPVGPRPIEGRRMPATPA